MTRPHNEGFKNKWLRQSIQCIANNNLNGDIVMKTLYEQLGGTYREENGRLTPEMILPEQTNYQIGKYGQFYLDYIKNHRRGRYTILLTEGTLNAQLHEIDLDANEMLDTIIPHLVAETAIFEYVFKLGAKFMLESLTDHN